MGITVIERGTPRTRRLNPRLALVLAGGAITGGAFKLGGLAALDAYLAGRKIADFDLYVGLSAGAFLAAPLAAGITPAELLDTVEGRGSATDLRVVDLYYPNFDELLWRPIEFLADLALYVPQAFADLVLSSPATIRRLRSPLAALREDPSFEHVVDVAREVLAGLALQRPFPIPLDYLPSGLFDNQPIEGFIRREFAARGLTNNFRALYRERGKELYVVAVNLDTAERVVFGHDEESALSISEAVQASTALPGFYKPARTKGVDYIDGSVRRTANLDVAIEHGADLIVCYNPFRPFNNEIRPGQRRRREPGRPLADHGMIAVLNQVFRSLLHSRLHLALHAYRDDPGFHGDIVLIEPGDTDDTFFNMFPLNLWERQRAAEHGYLSVSESLEAHSDTLARIFERYGLTVNRKPVLEGAERIRAGHPDEAPRLAG